MDEKALYKQKAIGVALQYSQMILNIIIQLVYMPFMLRILGTNEFGIYSIASSTISYLSLISLGFGASYIRWYSIFKKDNNEEKIARLNGLYLIVFLIMGSIGLLAGFTLSYNVDIFFNASYSLSEIKTAKVLMFFLTINIAISFPASLFVSYITSQERFIFQKSINMLSTVATPIANVLFLILGFGTIGMVTITTIVSIIIAIINVMYCLRCLKMNIMLKDIDWKLLRDIFSFSVFIAINQIIDQINWQTDKVVLGKMVNGTAVAVYSVGANLNTMFTSFSTAISSVFIPQVNKIVSSGESDIDIKLTDLFIKVGRIQWFVLTLILTGFIFFGEYFVNKWAGNEYNKAYYVSLLLMVPAVIPLIQNIGIEIQRAKYLHKFRSIAYFFMAIINVLVSIRFSSKWGEIGAALGTTISILFANGLIMNIYYQKKCGIDILHFWKNITSTAPAFVIPVIFGIILMLIYLFGLNIEEKSFIQLLVKKIIRK